MKGIQNNLISLSTLLPVVFLAFFLNYLSASYSEADLFKLDLTQKRDEKIRKLIFILKNGHLLFTIVCFAQIIFSTLISAILVESLDFTTIKDKIGLGQRGILLWLAFVVALFTELLARFLAIRKSNRKIITSSFLVNITYAILRPLSFLQFIIKPKKKLFADSETDLIRFFNNLMAERVLEKKETRLVQSALRFDETAINYLITPKNKVIFLQETMNLEEVKNIYSQYFFTRYPVLDHKKKKVIGILSMKRLFWTLISKKKSNWKNQIDKKVHYILPSTKLNKAFEKTQNWHCRMLIIKTRNRKENSILGIITLHDILNYLVGKMNNDLEKLLPSLHANHVSHNSTDPEFEDNPNKT